MNLAFDESIYRTLIRHFYLTGKEEVWRIVDLDTPTLASSVLSHAIRTDNNI